MTEPDRATRAVIEACRYQPPTGPVPTAQRHVDTLYRLLTANHRGRAIEAWSLLSVWERRQARGSMLERFAVRWWVRILPTAWRSDLRVPR